ncbi:MAG: hypothetical protein ACOH2N_14960 [Devosia sp.]
MSGLQKRKKAPHAVKSAVEHDYAYARLKNVFFDEIRDLYEERKDNWNLTLDELAKRMEKNPKTGRSWVSRELSGPGNWTLQTISKFIESLSGEIILKVVKREDIRSHNYDYYRDELGIELPTSHSAGNRTQIANAFEVNKLNFAIGSRSAVSTKFSTVVTK